MQSIQLSSRFNFMVNSIQVAPVPLSLSYKQTELGDMTFCITVVLSHCAVVEDEGCGFHSAKLLLFPPKKSLRCDYYLLIFLASAS